MQAQRLLVKFLRLRWTVFVSSLNSGFTRANSGLSTNVQTVRERNDCLHCILLSCTRRLVRVKTGESRILPFFLVGWEDRPVSSSLK